MIRAEIEYRSPLNKTCHCFSSEKTFFLSLPQYLLQRIPLFGECNKGIRGISAFLHMQAFLKTSCNIPPPDL